MTHEQLTASERAALADFIEFHLPEELGLDVDKEYTYLIQCVYVKLAPHPVILSRLGSTKAFPGS